MKKNIIITGGNEGLGKTLCEKLSADNNIIIIAKNKNSIEETIKQTNCDGFICDIRDAKAVNDTVLKIIDKYKRIDILINNAGLYIKDELILNDYDDIKDVLDVNLLGTINCTKAIIPYMKQNEYGQIININSQLGNQAKAERTIYATSKWGITGFSKCMQQEIGKYNIKVANILLGSLEETMKINGHKYKRELQYLNKKDIAEIINNIINLPHYICIPEITIKSIQEYKD